MCAKRYANRALPRVPDIGEIWRFSGRFQELKARQTRAGSTLRWTFVKLSRQIGLRRPSKSHGIGPRLHDMRHTFAVNTLLRWYRDGVDVERHIPRLATWLGHAHVSDTYWYLTATPELMQLAARRLDRIARGARP